MLCSRGNILFLYFSRVYKQKKVHLVDEPFLLFLLDLNQGPSD